MKKIKVLSVFGTRPEAIKMAPLILELQKRDETFESIVVITAQHREMLDQVLDSFGIQPDFDLDIMKDRQTLTSITSSSLNGLDDVIKEVDPDVVLVHGDTTTTMSASLAAFYNQVKIGHVEAGLRTWNKFSPFPEEVNRQITDILSDFYFSPTNTSKENLLNEGISEDKIYVTGNTVIDALKYTVNKDYHHKVLDRVDSLNRMVLITMHRRENQGKPMEDVFESVRQVVDKHSDVEIVFPVHLNPVVQEAANRILGEHDRIHLIEPVNVFDFHNLAAKSYFIMSDSGGVQEEAPSLSKPVMVLRNTTERPEGIEAGTLELVGTDKKTVFEKMQELLNDKEKYNKMANAENPYGDGEASIRIADALEYEFGIKTTVPNDFEVN